MNRPQAVGTLLVRFEENNGRADTENSAVEAVMETRRQKWRWPIIGKKDRFIWQGGSRGEEVLYKPNFEYDAEQIIADNNINTHTEDANDDDIGVAEKKQRIIDQRMRALSSLFTSCRNDDRTENGHRDNSSGTLRATDLTDEEFIDFVLNGPHHPYPVKKDEKSTTISDHGMEQIIQNYQECRQEKRNLGNTYIAERRSILPEPWLERDDGEHSSVQIDRHGRLIRTRRESNIDAAANVDDATESSNDGLEELELVDAAGAFWRQIIKSSNTDRSRGGVERRGSSVVSNATDRPPLPGILRPPQQPPPPQLQPLPQNPLNQQHIRERTIAQRMEHESHQAIERAIHRYRIQQQQGRDEAVFEMVDIPLIRPINEANVPRWLRFLSFNRQQRNQQQHANNDNAGDNPHQQQNEQQDHQNGEREGLRLALRRICFAVITVAAAFICMMLQGLPLVDFGDDAMELHPIFLSGLMGPHYPGHHPRQHHNQPRNEWVFPEIAEEEEVAGDVQQSIWNRLGVEDRYHLSRDATSEGDVQSSNDGGAEL